MSEKFLVIGSNSFSGAHFIRCALEKNIEVVGISRSPEIESVFLPYRPGKHLNYTFHQFDLNHDLESIVKILFDVKPQIIVNFAAQGMVAESWNDPAQWVMTNTVSAIKLHDRLRTFDFIDKFVQISTPEVYGDCAGVIKENTIYNPSTPYAVSKAAVDMSLMSFYRAYDFPVVFTRAANVYGPCQQLYRIIPRAILYFLLGKKLLLHGGGCSMRSFIHIRDVVEGTIQVARKATPGEIFHFSSDKYISIKNLVQMIAEQIGVDFFSSVEIVGDRLGKDQFYYLDSSKARTEMGWDDRITLEQGIEETIAWVHDNIDELGKLPSDYIHKA